MDAPELYVEPDLRGYGWYFPKRDFINIGIGCTGGADAGLRERRDALIAALRASGRLPADLAIEPFKGHAYVVRRQAPRRLAGARFCLVGDAAGPRPRPLAARASGPRSGAAASPPRRRARSCARGTSLAGYAREVVAALRAGRAGLARPAGRQAPRRGGAGGGAGHPGLGRRPAARGVRLDLRHAGGRVMNRSETEAPRGGDLAPLRRLQRVLHAVPRPADGLHLRLLPRSRRQARAGADGQARPRVPQAPPRARRDDARHRLRLGQPLDLGRPALRRARARRHAVAPAGGVGGGADQARGPGGPLPRRAPRLLGRAEGRALRQDRRHRRHRARRDQELPGVLRARARAAPRRRALPEPRHQARVPLEAHQPDRLPPQERLPQRRPGRRSARR